MPVLTATTEGAVYFTGSFDAHPIRSMDAQTIRIIFI
jgi:hypothetical protein